MKFWVYKTDDGSWRFTNLAGGAGTKDSWEEAFHEAFSLASVTEATA